MRMKMRDFVRRPSVRYPYEILRLNGAYMPRLPMTDFRAQGLNNAQTPVMFAGSHTRSMERQELKPVLEELFNACSEKKKQNYIVILGKTDWDLGEEILEIIPNNVVRVYGSNMAVNSSRISYFPMGRDFRSQEAFHEIPIQLDRDITCYANFSVSTHPSREYVKAICDDLGFVMMDHMGQFLDYPISRHEFFRRLARSNFSVCPRGNGIETFRMWDCLYYGVVPIVIREAEFFAQ